MRIPNILPMLLLAYSMSAQNAPCNIFDLTAQVVDCANGQFFVKLDFQHTNTSDLYRVQGNGIVYDTFSYNQVPVIIGPLAANGTTNYEFVVRDLAHPDCQDVVQLGPVTCTAAPCKIYDLVAEPGDCTSDSTYQLKMTFKVDNATNDKFDLWGNGVFIGSYNLSQLPLSFNNFPAAAGSLGGYVKVCINDNPDCCQIKQFTAPDCTPDPDPCKIYDVAIETGGCNDDGTYKLQLNFKVNNPGNDFFEIWAANGKYLGYHKLSALPLSIAFPWGGGPVDAIKICINDHPDCCTVKEFPAPACFNPCQLRNLRVDAGDCTSDSTYKVLFNFDVPAGVDSFGVWAGNGQFLGNFSAASLPISIANFPWGGGSIDAIKVCINNTCCRTKEFNVPACLAPDCAIDALKVEVGACTTPKSYKVVLNFKVNAPSLYTKFEVWAENGMFLGTHDLSALPLSLEVPWNGDKTDALKVCLLNNDGKVVCCRIISFNAPDCVGVSCGIFNLTVKTGDCNPDGTYQIWVDFQTPAVSLNKFGIWAGTGQFLGFYSVANLPVLIKKFPWGGGSLDKIIVCFGNACCEVKEFNPPACATQPCGIVQLEAIPGDCTSDSTYALKINFKYTGPSTSPDVKFSVYADNGQFLGTYTLADLPITIANFPWNGQAVDGVKICIGKANGNLCCQVAEFKAPACTGAGCGIFDLKVETGDCNDDGTYQVWVNFKSTAAVGAFGVWAGNGQFLGAFLLSDLPVKILHFPGSGGAMDELKVCLISTTNTPPCCISKSFKAPDCGGPCSLYDLTVKTGDCTSDSTYNVWVNFKVSNPGNTTLFDVYANGQLYGQFPLSALPLKIEHFPYNGGANDVVKICLVTLQTVLCCETKEFPVPDCLQQSPCEIYDLKVETGDCTSDSTYKVVLNFKVQNPGTAAKFGVWANGQFVGYYALSDLPLSIANFPWSGNAVDVIKVCVLNTNSATPTCCATKEFKAPGCLEQACNIYDLKVETGDCNDAGKAYEVWVNFKVDNPPAMSTHFGVWANGTLLGFFPLSQLPLYIPKFPSNGGPNDVIKVCLSNTGAVSCCETLEFAVPDCIEGPCEIYDLAVTTGDCHNDGTYTVKVDFKVQNPGNNLFEVWAGNGTYLGKFPLNQLPVVISNFPWGGGTVDVIKICINDQPNCCRVKEFKAPDCVQTGNCEIYDLKVETGDCNTDGTYHAWVNFKVDNPGLNTQFGLWANGTYLGTYNLSSLPLHIEHFPTDGGPNDVVKVCMLSSASTPPVCCRTLEFPVPACLKPCEIYDLKVETGDCNADGTYHAWVNFKVVNPTNTTAYGVWANGSFLGTFNLGNLPLHIEHFPTNGGPNDVVKVCLLTPGSTNPICCATVEFKVPDCTSAACKIYDLAVQHTPCLCGQFFAILTFKFQDGGSGGFDIVGNGVDYGNFPYNQPQPIVLGPLDGDALTEYEFEVHDHLHPDCHDAVQLGKVDCSAQFQAAGTQNKVLAAGKLSLSPNPTSNWLSVTAQLSNGVQAGQATVEVRQADGRLLRTQVVPDGNNFLLDVSDLQAGVYRLSLQTATARLESTFAKQ
ncbi:MAG: T9SS type A sorting domain-containing protein [Saprospiraceae bacterium]|nr:T9SS type A sorting domain-containing protein [Saprospiraceae bacterium]